MFAACCCATQTTEQSLDTQDRPSQINAVRLGWSSDQEIEKVLTGVGAPPEVSDFVAAVHKLYFDSGREKVANVWQPPDKDPTFHNWDHGRNVWNFASWYASQDAAFACTGGSATSNEMCALALNIAALCHDVMHPGTPNQKPVVEETFLPQVQRWATAEGIQDFETKDLKGFAEDLWEHLRGAGVDETHFMGALGKGFCSKEKEEADSSFDVADLLINRAPQETLHAWITMRLLQKHVGAIYNTHAALILVPITMTSINLHFMTMGNHGAYVDAMRSQPACYQLGLILRGLDMGWCSQEGIAESYSDRVVVGTTFGPRFLIESGSASGDYTNGEQKFADIVGAYVKELSAKKILPDPIADQFASGIASHRSIVGTPEFHTAVEKLKGFA